MTNQNRIRLALIGAGIFARDVHVPALLALENIFEIVAVYSRTQANAAAVAGQFPGPVEATTDLTGLLARTDIEAVSIILPIDVMAGVIELALRSGKHVISEKPLAADVATGRRLLELYASSTEQIWVIGENWRYEDAFEQAAALVHNGELGRPLLGHWVVYNPINPDNKYYHTPWRRSGNHQGGFLLDVGVHHVAVLRWLLGEISGVSAVTGQIRPDLPPADVLSAALQFESGASGVYLATYALNAPWPPALGITGERGSLWVHRQGLEVTSSGATRARSITPHQGVKKELAAFAAAIRQGEPHRNSPEQCLQDVAVIEAMLRSAATGRHVTPERIVG